MRKALPLLMAAIILVASTAHAAFTPKLSAAPTYNSELYVNETIAQTFAGNLEGFIKLTPAEYQKLTGQKLTLKEKLKLKAAQSMLKKQMKKAGNSSVPQVLYIILAIIGFGWLAMGILDGWKGNNWWINLILSLLFIIPGLIHALIVMGNYY
jgi:uncharacterized membrane protein YqaE (UPF0057 family)